MSKVFEDLKKRNLIKPLDLKPLPPKVSPSFNPNLKCLYHQQIGHDTNTCYKLRDALQDLINSGKIPNPDDPNRPSTRHNPLPNHQNNNNGNHQAVPGIYMLSTDVTNEKTILSSIRVTPYKPLPMSVIGRDEAYEAFKRRWCSPNKDQHGKKPSFQIMKDDQNLVVNMVRGTPDSGYLVPFDFWETGRFYNEEKELAGDTTKESEEDSVLRQLRHTKENATVWDLLVASKTQRDAMFEALASMKIDVNSTLQDMVHLVKESKDVTFSDKDLTSEDRNHTRALHIQVETKGRIVPRVMVDDSSALNVCPLKVLPKLGMTKDDLQKTELIIRGYDESRRQVEGTFKTIIKVRPIESVVEFMVVDIPISYALLLGRPWFHALGGIPSTLHQKIKFPFNDEVITISAEEDTVCSKVDLGAEIPPITGFNLVGGIYEDYMDPQVAMMMKNIKFFPGLGLGKNQQGIPTIPDF
ncbi:uncharacterized protein LOC126672500 [Mercurialis annua]|uniref:uncharacterized protein LOC126672500 n=1 Tax=Mercurialis annua TaxID=3986 RepID=UPI00215FED52|nr:uncharacterized protein LOC126672500 [Mercurialis annua]